MKVFILLAIVCFGISSALPDARGLKQEIFNRFVNKLGVKVGLKTGLSVHQDLRFPVLPPLPIQDPLPLPDYSFDIGENEIGLELSASYANVVLEGLTSWTDDLKLNILTQRVTYAGDIKSVKLAGGHTFNFKMINLATPWAPITASANGDLLVSLDGSHFDFGFTLAVNFTTTRVYVKNVVINLDIAQASYFAQNAEYIGSSVNWDEFNALLKPYFDELFANYEPLLEEILTEVLNEVVGQYTLAEIIEFIINIGKPKTTVAPILL